MTILPTKKRATSIVKKDFEVKNVDFDKLEEASTSQVRVIQIMNRKILDGRINNISIIKKLSQLEDGGTNNLKRSDLLDLIEYSNEEKKNEKKKVKEIYKKCGNLWDFLMIRNFNFIPSMLQTSIDYLLKNIHNEHEVFRRPASAKVMKELMKTAYTKWFDADILEDDNSISTITISRFIINVFKELDALTDRCAAEIFYFYYSKMKDIIQSETRRIGGDFPSFKKLKKLSNKDILNTTFKMNNYDSKSEVEGHIGAIITRIVKHFGPEIEKESENFETCRLIIQQMPIINQKVLQILLKIFYLLGSHYKKSSVNGIVISTLSLFTDKIMKIKWLKVFDDSSINEQYFIIPLSTVIMTMLVNHSMDSKDDIKHMHEDECKDGMCKKQSKKVMDHQNNLCIFFCNPLKTDLNIKLNQISSTNNKKIKKRVGIETVFYKIDYLLEYFKTNSPIGIEDLLNKMEIFLFKRYKTPESINDNDEIKIEFTELRKGVVIWRCSGSIDVGFDECCKKLTSTEFYDKFPSVVLSSEDDTYLYRFSTPPKSEWFESNFHAYLFRKYCLNKDKGYLAIFETSFNHTFNSLGTKFEKLKSNSYEVYVKNCLHQIIDYRMRNRKVRIEVYGVMDYGPLFSWNWQQLNGYILPLYQFRFDSEFYHVLTMAKPLKYLFCQEQQGIDYEKLLDSSAYKEKFRLELSNWSWNKMQEDIHIFSRIAVKEAALKPLWIVSDIRRTSDIKYILDKRECPHLFVRIEVSEEIRKERGWSYVKGIDDSWSECELDHNMSWDIIFHNDNDQEHTDTVVDSIKKFIEKCMNNENTNFEKMDKWSNKVALVTGASSGIGAAIAKILTEWGMTVIGVARRYDRIEELASKLKQSGAKGKLVAMKCDLRNEEDILEVFDDILNDFGGVDVLVNNAGLLATTSLLQGKTKEWKNIFEVNVLAMSICTREFYKQLKRRKVDNGHIINNCSLLGHVIPNIPFAHFYMGTKFAIKALTEGFRQELRSEKTNELQEISSGFVDTEMLKPHRAIFANIKILKPKDIAEVVINILSAPPGVEMNEIILRPIDEEM
ncbi:DgyrCDS2455 [Dimorphilus gyrociliatus]|uniref:DgyrCDS2455 n=1 Tax=Dimorphilus gyrociliatus TaxID=2664684 RepID=A0A7I8VFG6_9ANNE|nr:DgyrCDS2455 [Dimorphilus gyrociliatus]